MRILLLPFCCCRFISSLFSTSTYIYLQCISEAQKHQGTMWKGDKQAVVKRPTPTSAPEPTVKKAKTEEEKKDKKDKKDKKGKKDEVSASTPTLSETITTILAEKPLSVKKLIKKLAKSNITATESEIGLAIVSLGSKIALSSNIADE